MNRNVNDTFAKTPTPHFPRSRFDMNIHKRLQTQGHGRLYPFFARLVYPGDTWQMDMTTFCRVDTSLRVPLDDIFLDTFWFFVPLRIIDENFPKVLGEGEPSDYDDVDYEMPAFGIDDSAELGINHILPYLGYNQSELLIDNHVYQYNYIDSINPYALAAYYKIYNDWFRDENLDPSIPYKDLYGTDIGTLISQAGQLFDDLNCLKINRLHDYFSSVAIAPQKGPAQTIPLGTSAPVGFVSPVSGTTSSAISAVVPAVTNLTADTFIQLGNESGGISASQSKSVIADLSQAAGTINELRLAFAIQALYERRGRFGTRYIETIRGQWGIEVPDSFFLRPEYLGGSRVTLNNVPVLSTENSNELGQMSGNSSTLSNGGSWTKTFIEYGILIGVSCTRVKHSYTQGVRKELFDIKTALDLYNPVFANIGLQPVYQRELFNVGESGKDVVFGYEEAWNDLRSDYDSFAGLFGMFSENTEIQNKWHYGDYYAPSNPPVFSADWLKEPYQNVARTLTGNLIAGASYTETEGHQFMFGYYYHPIVTRILPSHSVPVELIGRL